MFVEAGFGLIAGLGGTAMLLGISPTALLSAQVSPALLPFVLESARGADRRRGQRRAAGRLRSRGLRRLPVLGGLSAAGSPHPALWKNP